MSANYTTARPTAPESSIWSSGWCIVPFSSLGHNGLATRAALCKIKVFYDCDLRLTDIVI
jgi:hypothetical protein